jgi:hypothetical protein
VNHHTISATQLQAKNTSNATGHNITPGSRLSKIGIMKTGLLPMMTPIITARQNSTRSFRSHARIRKLPFGQRSRRLEPQANAAVDTSHKPATITLRDSVLTVPTCAMLHSGFARSTPTGVRRTNTSNRKQVTKPHLARKT